MSFTRKQKQKKGHQLFNNNPPGHYPTTKGTGYGSAEKARKTLKLIRKRPLSYQKQVATTMMFRAKFHKYQNSSAEADEQPFVSPNNVRRNKGQKV